MQSLGLPVLAAAICGAALSGCGQNPAPSTVVADAWDNHFTAFGNGVAAQDLSGEEKVNKTNEALAKIMLDYDSQSVVKVYTYGSDSTMPGGIYTSVSAIEGMFSTLFTNLAGCDGNADDQIQASYVVDESGANVFLVWRCTRANFWRATDTFIFDGAIIRTQNIVVAPTETPAAARDDSASIVQVRRLASSLQEAWDNHAEAFTLGVQHGGGRNDTGKDLALDQIMQDYHENSVVRIYTFTGTISSADPFETHTGMTAIRAMFNELFASFTVNAVEVAMAEVISSQVFLIWKAPASGYKEATDTFIFDDNFKINRQNIALFK